MNVIVATAVLVVAVNVNAGTVNIMLDNIIGGIANLWTKGEKEESKPTVFNNPGNIEIGQGHAGETGDTYADRFAVFDSPQMGVRALGRDLKTKIKRFDGDLFSIINQFAPESENDTDNYYQFVKEQVGSDTITENDLGALVRAIIKMENKPEVAAIYLNDNIINEGLELSQIGFDSDVSLDEARELISQKG